MTDQHEVAETKKKPRGKPFEKGNARGKPFEKGNGGRPPGSRNRTSVVADALLRDEETELVRKAVELAKAGDVAMLKFLLGRILPRERTVKFYLPGLESATDAATALDVLVKAVAEGKLSPPEGAAIAQLVSAFSRAADIADHETRIARIEAQLEAVEKI